VQIASEGKPILEGLDGEGMKGRWTRICSARKGEERVSVASTFPRKKATQAHLSGVVGGIEVSRLLEPDVVSVVRIPFEADRRGGKKEVSEQDRSRKGKEQGERTAWESDRAKR